MLGKDCSGQTESVNFFDAPQTTYISVNSHISILLYMENEDVRCIAIWLFQWLALGLSIPGLLFGWAVIAWSCFLFLVGALVLGGISQLFSLCSHCAIKQSK